ncbi:ras family-domain-containing protein [Biscogniauxia mediterranea]|nr:ras family-domain-containing protein [Biscogniauxia mediterranea]
MANPDPKRFSYTFTDPSKENLKLGAGQPKEPCEASEHTVAASVSEFWKPDDDPFRRWISTIPSPVKRKRVMTPARIQTPKRELQEIEDAEKEASTDGHRDKRPRISSALSRHSTRDSQGQRVRWSGREIVRRVSNACRRVVSSGRSTRSGVDRYTNDTSTYRASTSLPTTPTTIPDRPKMRIMLVGDMQCGKSSLLLRYYRDTFNPSYEPTRYEMYTKVAGIDGQEVELELWDTCGDIKLNQLKLLSYMVWDAALICFDVNSSKRYKHAKTRWLQEVRKYYPNVSFILVGLKKDERLGKGLWAPPLAQLETRIPAAEGTFAANTIGAIKYMECSAKTGEGVNRVFTEVARTVLDERAAEEEAREPKKEKEKERVSGAGSTLASMLCFQ